MQKLTVAGDLRELAEVTAPQAHRNGKAAAREREHAGSSEETARQTPDSDPAARPRFVRWLFPGLDWRTEKVTRQELLDYGKTVFAAVALVSMVPTSLSIYLQRSVIQAEYDWRHRKEAQDILRTWDERTSKSKAAIESFFRKRYDSDEMQPIRAGDAVALRTANNPDILDVLVNAAASEPHSVDGPAVWWNLRVSINEMLNYFELVSTECEQGIASEAIIRDSLGPPMVQWREYLRTYTDEMDRIQNRQVWGPYYRVTERWKNELARLNVRVPPPGSMRNNRVPDLPSPDRR